MQFLISSSLPDNIQYSNGCPIIHIKRIDVNNKIPKNRNLHFHPIINKNPNPNISIRNRKTTPKVFRLIALLVEKDIINGIQIKINSNGVISLKRALNFLFSLILENFSFKIIISFSLNNLSLKNLIICFFPHLGFGF